MPTLSSFSTSSLTDTETIGHVSTFLTLLFGLIARHGSGAQITWFTLSALSFIASVVVSATILGRERFFR
ncbi:hypothetical protein [Burkholderia pseudomallei]|uniref:hypothetical protein n=1 Tax=Burkholderia pseudomallei TaxID=28450 RepID=UPI000F08C60F|nr:hypothetical protein [Burkholderia pseudomallei]CAJ3070810.1 Uncharacterised protein [Burkholderia pseudomallei]VCK72961.1 Uncharacterised protein [Burkholderia pseudomallei]VCK79924.1 Uncharacterised protein [Burkholderia pseudomallei]VCK80098.1 Uncharacterised protein [Burkholderia pseudomallei]VCK80850.1 Uncharacterised protein [Burkholderia pseudomallei]